MVAFFEPIPKLTDTLTASCYYLWMVNFLGYSMRVLTKVADMRRSRLSRKTQSAALALCLQWLGTRMVYRLQLQLPDNIIGMIFKMFGWQGDVPTKEHSRQYGIDFSSALTDFGTEFS